MRGLYPIALGRRLAKPTAVPLFRTASRLVPGEQRENMQFLHREFPRNKRKIARDWTLLTSTGKAIRILVDAAYPDQIFDVHSHKISFVQPK